MQYNPKTKTLFTGAGAAIKQLDCQYKINWNLMPSLPGSEQRLCRVCDKPVLDVTFMQEQALLAVLAENPQTCLKLSTNASTITLVNVDD